MTTHSSRRWAVALVVVFSAGCERQITPQPSSPIDDPSKLRISGQVMEPAANAPVEGARVCWSAISEERCAVTGPDGTYLLLTDRPVYPPTVRSARLAPTASKDGFEYRQAWIPDDFSGYLFWSPGLQRILQIDAGASVAGIVYPQEGSGLVDDGCGGCKRIRIAVPFAGELSTQLTVGSDTLRTVISRDDDRPSDAPLSVQAGMTVFVWVTNAIVPTPFELSTRLTPPR